MNSLELMEIAATSLADVVYGDRVVTVTKYNTQQAIARIEFSDGTDPTWRKWSELGMTHQLLAVIRGRSNGFKCELPDCKRPLSYILTMGYDDDGTAQQVYRCDKHGTTMTDQADSYTYVSWAYEVSGGPQGWRKVSSGLDPDDIMRIREVSARDMKRSRHEGQHYRFVPEF